SIRVFMKYSSLEYGPVLCDKPIIEWGSDSIPFEMIDHYEVYEFNKTWQKIAQIKKDSFYYILEGNYILGNNYSFKINFVLKNSDIYESLPFDYKHTSIAIQPVTIVKQDFRTIDGVKYFHVTWESPKGYMEATDESFVMFESNYTPNTYATYQNSLSKSKNEEYLEVYPQSVGKKLSFYIITRRNMICGTPSQKFSFVVE
uniref:hypothetical protein n=1 Tax=uncultured Cytophaga sp. TaxID=160238 RepID=UPI002625E87C